MLSRSKYGNVVTEYLGYTFHSKKEADYARTLDQMKRARKAEERVKEWFPQISLDIIVEGKKICKYIADFMVEYADGHIEYIDVKGFRTDVYKIKKKLVEAIYGIKIIEI